MSSNPYHTVGKPPTLQRSVLALMDILGYKDLMVASSKVGNEQEVLEKLHGALERARELLKPTEAISLSDTPPKDRFSLKAFTDNIVVGWPVKSDAESEFGDAFSRLAEFQLQMAIDGYFIRGGLSVGPAYVDEIAVFGGALLEAYDGESTLARDPRVVLTKSAVEVTHRHLSYYSPGTAPHIRHILKDSDGQWFLNYLETVMWLGDEYGPLYELLLQHKTSVEQKLSEYRRTPAIWSKYAWVASYHNFFCDLHPEHCRGEHRINVELFRATPSLIVE